MKKIFSSLLFCLFVITTVYGEEPKYYLGASYLSAETDLIGEKDNDSGFEARVGYILNKNLSFEASYIDLGTQELPNIPDGGGSIESNGYSIAALGVYPIGEFNLIGKVGCLFWESEGTLGSVAGPVQFDSDGSDLILGGGISYIFTKHFEIKLEYNDSKQFNWGAIGVNYRF